jgi:cold shock CspA family protein
MSSSESFSKKEKEKKKLKKKQDKEQKKEERKNNTDKGKSLEEMFVYVDEYGNITSTPPDPTKKQKINVEDIAISTAKYEANPEDLIKSGIVNFYNTDKGFGFIRDLKTQDKIFFHVNGLIDAVKENDKVTFETEKGLKGMNAVNVKLQK